MALGPWKWRTKFWIKLPTPHISNYNCLTNQNTFFFLKQNRIHISWYALGDCVAAIISWVCFYFVRKQIIDEQPIVGPKFYLGLFLYPIAWLIYYYLVGTYRALYHKSRLIELLNTLAYTFFGCLFILFTFLLYDATGDYNIYYKEFISLWGIHSFLLFL